MNKNSNINILILVLLSVVLFAYILLSQKNSESRRNIIQNTEIHDTIFKIVPSKPLTLTKVKTKIVKVSDSSIVTHPFVAKIDTIVLRDTIRAAFEFPQNLMSLQINKKPDSMLVARTTLITTVEKERPWWETASYIIGGAFVGYLIGHK
ncbi:MAG: hypothetical protein ABSG15_00470 [FCB group bacterium]|jgi:predicted transporter